MDPHGLLPLAQRVVQRVAALGDRFPPMRGADPTLYVVDDALDTSAIPWTPRFEARWAHEHGVTREPDPTYVPTPFTARSPTRRRLDPQDGLSLTVWLFEGAWLMRGAVTPIELGRLRVVLFLEAPNDALRTELESAIRTILASESTST